MKLQTVHLRVNDLATGQPTPCRIRISDSSGSDYAPFGHTLDFSTNRGEDVGGKARLGRHNWFSIDGACEIALPAGELRVQVSKGLDYAPIDQVIHQPMGKMSIRLSIGRNQIVGKPHMRTMDMRCHFSTPHTTVLDAAAEDLDIVNLLAEPVCSLGMDGNSYGSVPNLSAFSGQFDCLERFGSKVIVNTHHRHPILGSLSLLHCHRVVYPLTFGGADATDDWSLRDWANQSHRKGGLVVWTEQFGPNKPHAGEALALAVMGAIDAYELTSENWTHALRQWYQLLNAGIRLPLVGSSGHTSNNSVLGSMQTVCAASGENWPDLIKLGSSVTNGPVCKLAMDGNRIYASARSQSTFERVELVANGEVVASDAGKLSVDGSKMWVATIEHEVQSPTWVAARVLDPVKSLLDDRSALLGHTSAEWVGEPRAQPQAAEFVRAQLGKGRDWVENEGRFDEPKSKAKLLKTFDEALSDLAGMQTKS